MVSLQFSSEKAPPDTGPAQRRPRGSLRRRNIRRDDLAILLLPSQNLGSGSILPGIAGARDGGCLMNLQLRSVYRSSSQRRLRLRISLPHLSAGTPRKLGRLSAADLLMKELPPVRYVVPSYLAEGLTIPAGWPMLGKSWLSLDLAIAVASGGLALSSGFRPRRVRCL